MARTPEAKIKADLLLWARESSGLGIADAAKKLSVKTQRLEAWEAGEARPSVAQLRKAGEVYKRPLAVFFLPEPPRDFQPLSDFRRLPDTLADGWSPELRVALRRAEFQQEIAAELYRLLGEDIPTAPTMEHPPSNPEEFGAAAREMLHVNLDAQEAWGTPHEALNGWIAAMEDIGILVLQAQHVDLAEMRGFSLSTGEIPTIVLNGSDSANGRVFTIIHEFAHLLLSNTGVCDLHDRPDGTPTDRVELFCNAVAASVLLPGDAFLAEPLVSDQQDPAGWSDPTLTALAEKYSVSREVVLRRLWTHKLTSWDFMQTKVRQFRKGYEEDQRRREERKGGPTFYRMRIRDYGRAYLRLALDAYHRDEINASQLSSYVEVKLNKLPKLEEELAKVGGT